MPISLTPYKSGELCQGHSWTVVDEDLLAQMIAKILMGKQRHVEKILLSAGTSNVSFRENAIDDAIGKLSLSNDEEPYHRDGLIFQILSWMAALKSKNEDSILRAPHLVMAQKGFDGLQININNGAVEAVVIFEDKATGSPRNFIRDKVWPEFLAFRQGERESELEQELSTLLDTRKDIIDDIENAIETIFWDGVRQFRVAITADAGHMNELGRARLFKGYDEIIPGRTTEFRRAECVHFPDLRSWMCDISGLAIQYLESYRESDNV